MHRLLFAKALRGGSATQSTLEPYPFQTMTRKQILTCLAMIVGTISPAAYNPRRVRLRGHFTAGVALFDRPRSTMGSAFTQTGGVKMFHMCPNNTVCEPGRGDRSRRQSSRPALVIASSVGLLMLCASGPAHATAAYVGLGVGNAAPTVDQGSVEFHTRDWSPNSTAWRLFGGYMLSERLGIEAGYISLGKVRVATDGDDFFEAKTAGFEVTPVVFLHVVAGLSAFARAGIIFWNSEASHHYTALGDGTKSESGTSLTGSLGIRYDLVGPLGVRAEYTRHAIDKTKGGVGDFNVIMLSAVVSF